MRYYVQKNNIEKVIPLGREGENDYTEIAFDISEWQTEYVIGSLILMIQRPHETEAYPTSVYIDGQFAVHTLTDTDLAFAGAGRCQLQMLSGAVIAKTRVFRTNCEISLTSGDVPAPAFAGIAWGQQGGKGAYIPYDAKGETDLGYSTVLVGSKGISLTALDDKTNRYSFANLLVLPPVYNISVESAGAGSTSYTTTSSLWGACYGESIDYMKLFKYAAVPPSGYANGSETWAFPTSVVQNADDTLTLTFEHSLNLTSIATKLMLGISLGSECRGTIASGNGIFNNGYCAVLAGAALINEGQNVALIGQNVQNSGNNSVVVGTRNKNTAARSIISGTRILNSKRDVALFGKGHKTADAPEGVAATGSYTDLGAHTLFAVGNGSDDDNRANALEVTDAGAAKATSFVEDGVALSDKYEAKGTLTIDGVSHSVTTRQIVIDGTTHNVIEIVE